MLYHLARAAAVAAFVAGTLLAPVPAVAGEKSAQVRYSDLNLASAAGKAKLERRIASAADRVCGVADEQMLPLLAAARRCAAAARETARPAVELAHRDAQGGQLAARDMSVTVTP